MAGRAFGGAYGQLPGVAAEDRLDRLRLGNIPLGRRGAVGVDVRNVLRVHPGAPERHPHAAGGAFAGRGGSCQMVSVSRVAVAGQFGIDARSAGLGVLQLLQNYDAAAFPHDEAVAVAVKRPGGALGIIIAGAQGAHGAESAQTQRDNRGFASAGEHHVGIAHLDGAPGFPQGVRGGGASRAGGHIGPAKIAEHGEKARSHVKDEHGDHERGKPGGAFGEVNLVLFFDRVEAAYARSNKGPHLIEIDGVEVQTGIPQRLFRREDGELGETVRPAGVFGRGDRNP